MLRRVGFFREFRGVGAPSLVDAQSGVSFDRRAQSYLQGGTVLVAVPGVITWPETGRVLCAGHIRTDGEWCWPEELSFLVVTNRLLLPPEFLLRMESLNWVAPSISLDELAALEHEVSAV